MGPGAGRGRRDVWINHFKWDFGNTSGNSLSAVEYAQRPLPSPMAMKKNCALEEPAFCRERRVRAAQDPEKARSLSACCTDLEVPEEALALEGLGLVGFC